jgi:hypothetical protein
MSIDKTITSHHFPPLPITPLKISCPPYNFTASLTFASRASLAVSSAASHPRHRLHQHPPGWHSSAPGSPLGSGGGGRHGSLPTGSHPGPSSWRTVFIDVESGGGPVCAPCLIWAPLNLGGGRHHAEDYKIYSGCTNRESP